MIICLTTKEVYSTYNYYSICRILQVTKSNQPVVRGFVWTVVEDLQELRSSQVEHKLRVKCELFAEAERVGIILVIVSKLLTLLERKEHCFTWIVLNVKCMVEAVQSK